MMTTQSDLIADDIKAILMRGEIVCPVSDAQAILINKLVEAFEATSERFLERYRDDIEIKRISVAEQIRKAQDYLSKHGHDCSDYRRPFVLRVYWLVQVNPAMAEISIGNIFKLYARCNAHRKILDELTARIHFKQFIKAHAEKFVENGVITKKEQFAKHLAILDPSFSKDTWLQRIKRLEKEHKKKGTSLH